MTELVPDTKRQASHIFRGYNYQAYQTILAWLKCGENEEILPEFAEDVDLVRRDAQGNITDAELTQVKNEKKQVTLNSKSAKNLIKNFFKHKKRNPDIILFIRLCAVSDRGKERKFDWVYADNGLDLWDCIKSRKLSEADQETAIGILKSFYFQKTDISKDTLAFIQESDSTVFLSDFIDRVSWDTGQSSYSVIEKDIKQVLANLSRPITAPLEVTQVIKNLWYFVTHSIAGEPGKALNRTDLEAILSEETTAKIDRRKLEILTVNSTSTAASVKNLERMLSPVLEKTTEHIQDATPVKVIEQQAYQSNFPPLLKPCADRSQEILEIQDALNGAEVLWIYGSTGYGKTTLANLYSRQTSSTGMWFRLRDYSNFILMAALQKICTFLSTQLKDRDIVVLDDLSNIEQQTYAIELLSTISDYAKKSSAKIIITSQYRLPSRLKAQIGDGLFEYVAPEMSETDISLLLNRHGLNDDELIRFWSTYIRASTSGHPQLVGAFGAYAKEKGWSFTAGMLGQQPLSVDAVKTESRKLLAETINSDEARELARHLSLITGPFDREFALNIGSAAPGVKEPGHALDTLIGPWIESLGNDIYSLSPLLKGYAEAEAGENGLERYYMILCAAWLKKRTLTPFEVSQAMLAALTAKFDPLISKLCNILFTESSEDFGIISKELYLIPLLYIESEAQLTGIHPMTRFMFRYFQLQIAENNADWKQYLSIYFQIQKEINELDVSSSEYKMCLWMFNIASIIKLNTPIPPKNRILKALKIIEMVQKSEFIDITSYLDLGKFQLDSLLVFAASKIDNYKDLQFLITELKKRSNSIVSIFFRGFEKYPDNLSLMIDMVWFNESKNENPAWNKCIKVFSEAMEFAAQYGNEWLLASAAAGIIVINDEYLDDSTNALLVADRTRASLDVPHPIIELQEATVRYRSGQYEKVIEATINLESSLTPEIMPIRRVYALSRAIRSAGELKYWDKAIYFAERGRQISQYIIVEGMSELAPICFEAELGWSYHEKGCLDKAITQFESVLTKMEGFSDKGYLLFNIFHLRLGSALGWLSHTLKMNGTIIQLKTSISKPFAGMFANFEDPPEKTKGHRVQAYPLLWAHLAKYSASFVDTDFIHSMAKRAMIRIGGKQFFLALTETHYAIHLNSLVNLEIDKALEAGMEYAKLIAMLPNHEILTSESWDFREPVDIDGYRQNLDKGFYDKWFDFLTTTVLEPMTMFLCDLNEKPNLDFSRWIDQFSDTFGEGHKSIKFAKWMEKVISTVFGDSDAIEMIRRDAWNSSSESEQTRRLSILAMCVLPRIPLAETLSAQFSMLKTMIHPVIKDSCWAIFFYRIVAKRWTYFANNQKFLMRSPRIWSGKILDAISLASPTISDVAKLLLLIGEAAEMKWPKEMLSELHELS